MSTFPVAIITPINFIFSFVTSPLSASPLQARPSKHQATGNECVWMQLPRLSSGRSTWRVLQGQIPPPPGGFFLFFSSRACLLPSIHPLLLSLSTSPSFLPQCYGSLKPRTPKDALTFDAILHAVAILWNHWAAMSMEIHGTEIIRYRRFPAPLLSFFRSRSTGFL